jgi:hypothetical protein
LITTNDGAADPFWQSFRLVHGDLGADQSNTETSEEASQDEHGLLRSGSLKCYTKVERNHGGDDDSVLATKLIRDVTSRKSTDEGADGKNRDDQSHTILVGAAKGFLPVLHLLQT